MRAFKKLMSGTVLGATILGAATMWRAPVLAQFVPPVPPNAGIPSTPPLYSGRSVSTGLRNLCATPIVTCELGRPLVFGSGCACPVSGGMSRGSVMP
jgi:hypothetical protein